MKKSSDGTMLTDSHITELTLTQTANEFQTHCGLDSIEHCVDKAHYSQYPTSVVYMYNSLGYRDAEWPADLTNSIWFVGDSFTVGLGQPYENTLPQIVQGKLGTRVINVSMNGASNDWISRRVRYILDNFNPKTIFIQWSYVHRRESSNADLPDEARAEHYDPNNADDLANFSKNLYNIKNSTVTIVHSFVPKFHSLWGERKLDEEIYQLLADNNAMYFAPPEQIDFARDGHHYDTLTATKYAELYIGKLDL